MGLERLDGETLYEYQKRLVYGKLVDKTLADYDYSEIAECLYGKQYASDVARRMMYGTRMTIDAIDEERISVVGACGGSSDDPDVSSIISERESQKAELKKERQKLYDQRTAFNKSIRDRSRQEELNEILEDALRSGAVTPLDYHRRYIDITSDNDMIVSLNDIHYGANIDNNWCTYNPDVCREMFRQYLDKIISVAELHRSERCYVVGAGDFISGNIHYSIAVTNKENVIKQIMGISELIAEFLSEISEYFREVKFISVSGNHSRLNPNKDSCLTEERLDDIIGWYLKARLQNHENVYIDDAARIDETMALFSVRGLTYMLVHGDFDSSPNKVQSLQTMARSTVYAVLCGHKHHNSMDVVQGIRVLMAGSFQGVDRYCVNNRIFGEPEQMICICNDSGIVCQYDVKLGSK